MNLFNTTTDSILSTFTKTIKKLESHRESMASDIETADLVIQVANATRAAKVDEQIKADKAIAKLKDFFA